MTDKEFFDQWYIAHTTGFSPGGIAGELGKQTRAADQQLFNSGTPPPRVDYSPPPPLAPRPVDLTEADKRKASEAAFYRSIHNWIQWNYEKTQSVFSHRRRPLVYALLGFRSTYLSAEGHLNLDPDTGVLRWHPGRHRIWIPAGEMDRRIGVWYRRHLMADIWYLCTIPGLSTRNDSTGRIVFVGTAEAAATVNGVTVEDLHGRLDFAQEALERGARGEFYPPVEGDQLLDCYQARPRPVSARALDARIRRFVLSTLRRNWEPFIQFTLNGLRIALPSRPLPPKRKRIPYEDLKQIMTPAGGWRD